MTRAIFAMWDDGVSEVRENPPDLFDDGVSDEALIQALTEVEENHPGFV